MYTLSKLIYEGKGILVEFDYFMNITYDHTTINPLSTYIFHIYIYNSLRTQRCKCQGYS